MTRRIVTSFAGLLPIPELIVLHRLRVAALVEFARDCANLSWRTA